MPRDRVSFSVRALLALVVAEAIVGRARLARAAGEAAPPDAWSLRFDGSVGFASVTYASDDSWVVRGGADAEYWLSRNFGLGAQLGVARFSTIDIGYSYTAGSTTRVSLAPAIAIRGSNPTSFPLFSLALGYAVGTTDVHQGCEYTDALCTPSSFIGSGSGAFGSMAAEWVFHPGVVRPGRAVFSFGPLARVDCYSLGEFGGRLSDAFNFGNHAWVYTVGTTMGFDVASSARP